MSISFIGSAIGSNINSANATVNVGGIAGIADGDFFVCMSGGYDRNPGTAGATTNGSGSFVEPVNTTSTNERFRCNYKFRSGDTTFTVAGTGDAGQLDAVAA